MKKIIWLVCIGESDACRVVDEEQVCPVVPAVRVFNKGVGLECKVEGSYSLEKSNHGRDTWPSIKPNGYSIFGWIPS